MADEDKVLFRLQTLLKEGVITPTGTATEPIGLGPGRDPGGQLRAGGADPLGHGDLEQPGMEQRPDPAGSPLQPLVSTGGP